MGSLETKSKLSSLCVMSCMMPQAHVGESGWRGSYIMFSNVRNNVFIPVDKPLNTDALCLNVASVARANNLNAKKYVDEILAVPAGAEAVLDELEDDIYAALLKQADEVKGVADAGELMGVNRNTQRGARLVPVGSASAPIDQKLAIIEVNNRLFYDAATAVGMDGRIAPTVNDNVSNNLGSLNEAVRVARARNSVNDAGKEV